MTWLRWLMAPSAAQLAAAAQLFPVFTRRADPEDALPADSAYRPGVARRVGQPGAVSAWAVATADGVCVTLDAPTGPARGGPAACNTPAELGRAGQLLALVSSDDHSSVQVIAGLAPQGVPSVTVDFADGSTLAVPVVDNGFVVSTSAARTARRFTWRRDGVAHSE